MSYTISDLQLSDKSLFNAIILMSYELKKTCPELTTKLLSNVNTYGVQEISFMFDGFRILFINSIVKSEKDTLDFEYCIKHNKKQIEKLIL